jgi:tRNA threonylcarbamoyl adenosine modification protein (Sua5/YciO/YrdC/YwlC family)
VSPVFDCSDEAGRADGIAKAAAAVRAGRLVVLPTDTLYGIGADAFDHDAVRALLDAKGRGREMPPPVLVADLRTAEALVTELPPYAAALAEKYWPGPLTLIGRAQPQLMWDLGETNGTVALRVPDHELALELLRETGPMAVSSANRTGYPAARNLVDAATQLGAAVEVYLDGGPVRTGLPSTIVDCTGERPVVLRQGALATEDIHAVTDPVLAAADVQDNAEENAEPEPTEPEPTEPERTEPATDGPTEETHRDE